MEKLEKEGLQLISINEILNESFFIPSYQRGYRWQKSQVIDLLEDIFEFTNKPDKTSGEFYCLQPIVVTKKENYWCVIDGQQRLTTIYIILKFLEETKTILFSLFYETRNKSKEFLEKIKQTTQPDDSNIDFYHMSSAYLTIKDWFEEKRVDRDKFLKTLLNSEIKKDQKSNEECDDAKDVRFIWYNVITKNEENDKLIFRKINMGKIPLTNAELIKALFFTSNEEKTEKNDWQNKVAYEWNEIEDALQDDEFWYFLNPKEKEKTTRIDLIFELISKNTAIKNIPYKKEDNYYTFNVFNHLIKHKTETVKELWEKVKKYFRVFKEWFYDNECYHLVGYLIHTEKSIREIFNLSENLEKSAFKAKLKEKIKDDLNILKEELGELNYYEEGDKNKIKNILLLFNIISTMNAENIRFPFKKYIKEKWSLEHIHAQNSENLKTDEQRRILLEEQEKYYRKVKDVDFTDKITELLKQKNIDLKEFEELQEKIFSKVTDGQFKIDNDSINNLALLSSSVNSALSNNIFPIKRDKIVELDFKGAFIPLCTKNVFLKYYSKDVEQNVKWMQKDREEYLLAIKNTLKEYIQEGCKNEK